MVGRCRLNSSGTGKRPVARSCEHSNEPSGSTKGREYEQLDSQEKLCSMGLVS
jgi:hypothetical protein